MGLMMSKICSPKVRTGGRDAPRSGERIGRSGDLTRCPSGQCGPWPRGRSVRVARGENRLRSNTGKMPTTEVGGCSIVRRTSRCFGSGRMFRCLRLHGWTQRPGSMKPIKRKSVRRPPGSRVRGNSARAPHNPGGTNHGNSNAAQN